MLRAHLTQDHQAHLERLTQQLGAPRAPSYSLLRAGPLSQGDYHTLKEALQTGVRLFLITPEPLDEGWLVDVHDHHLTRLLECEVVPDPHGEMPGLWCVDGELDEESSRWLDLADEPARGGINACQYRVVHAPVDVDVEVQAGAGTGKTETMIERALFLFSCHDVSPRQLGMVTFTKDAAKQMRGRLIKSLATRQRLCGAPIHPYLEWMSEVSLMPIKTIHAFSKSLISMFGAALGVTHEVKVGKLTPQVNALLRETLAAHLERSPHALSEEVAFHEWERAIKQALTALSRGGISTVIDEPLAWGQPLNPDSTLKHELLSEVIRALYPQLKDLRWAHQTFSTDELTPLALKSLQSAQALDERALRFLFVDEFQDTDPLQMELFQAYCERSSCKLFYVGDKKQAIYRFRGADDDAFIAMRRLQTQRGARTIQRSLTRNFRTGERLLNSLDPYFSRWGSPALKRLSYKSASDRLLPAPFAQGLGDKSTPLTMMRVPQEERLTQLCQALKELTAQAPRQNLSVAVLTRTNDEAYEAQRALREVGVACELATNGDFYQSLPVRELLSLLNALIDPHDKTALLNLLDTSWAHALSAQLEGGELEGRAWNKRMELIRLHQRKHKAQPKEELYSEVYDDLTPLMERLTKLREQARVTPLLAFVQGCLSIYQPERYVSLTESEEVRSVDMESYARGLNFLMTRLIETVGEAPLSLVGLVDHLTLKVAHDHDTNLPIPSDESSASVIALTVHRAKGQEYEVVYLPYTSRSFLGKRGGFKLLVDRAVGSPTRVYWREKGKYNEFGNQHRAAPNPWGEYDEQTCCEETRLLYVAMTRAQQRLIVYIEPKPKKDTWGQLL